MRQKEELGRPRHGPGQLERGPRERDHIGDTLRAEGQGRGRRPQESRNGGQGRAGGHRRKLGRPEGTGKGRGRYPRHQNREWVEQKNDQENDDPLESGEFQDRLPHSPPRGMTGPEPQSEHDQRGQPEQPAHHCEGCLGDRLDHPAHRLTSLRIGPAHGKAKATRQKHQGQELVPCGRGEQIGRNDRIHPPDSDRGRYDRFGRRRHGSQRHLAEEGEGQQSTCSPHCETRSENEETDKDDGDQNTKGPRPRRVSPIGGHRQEELRHYQRDDQEPEPIGPRLHQSRCRRERDLQPLDRSRGHTPREHPRSQAEQGKQSQIPDTSAKGTNRRSRGPYPLHGSTRARLWKISSSSRHSLQMYCHIPRPSGDPASHAHGWVRPRGQPRPNCGPGWNYPTS